MNGPVQLQDRDTSPWYRQFWPWFVIALPASAVIAGFVTLWIAIGAAPDRIDGFGAIAIAVEFTADRAAIVFDLGPANPATPWPELLTVTLVSRIGGDRQTLQARRFDGRYYQGPVEKLTPGAYEVFIDDEYTAMSFYGSWAYPAPVWKLRIDD